MDRRTFMAASFGSAAAKVLDLFDDADKHALTQEEVARGDKVYAKILFGDDLALVTTEYDSQVNVQTPWHKDFAGNYVLDRLTHCWFSRLVAPMSVWNQILKTYGDVTPDERPPVRVVIDNVTVCELNHALITEVGNMIQSQHMAVIENLRFMGVWTELHEAVKKYREAQLRDPRVQRQINVLFTSPY